MHLGERECSLQRRHQKVIEEAPSPLLDARDPGARSAQRRLRRRPQRRLHRARAPWSSSCRPTAPDEFFFMEMNTRLQVEHPVTELVTGLDLVEQQLRIAAGEPLPVAQDDVRADRARDRGPGLRRGPRARVPAHRRARSWRSPSRRASTSASTRASRSGRVVRSAYDPMLAKVIAWGADRDEALRPARPARSPRPLSWASAPTSGSCARCSRTRPCAPATWTPRWSSARRRVRRPPPPRRGVRRRRAAGRGRRPAASGADRWDRTDGWRLGEPAWSTWRFQAGQHDPISVLTRPTGTAYERRGSTPRRRPPPTSAIDGDDVGSSPTPRRPAPYGAGRRGPVARSRR